MLLGTGYRLYYFINEKKSKVLFLLKAKLIKSGTRKEEFE
jgi:hypothetical protein